MSRFIRSGGGDNTFEVLELFRAKEEEFPSSARASLAATLTLSNGVILGVIARYSVESRC